MSVTFPIPEMRPKEIDTEVTTLENHYSEIAKRVGKYVLIQGESVIAYFDSYREAHHAGYAKFGLGDFLVRFINKSDTPISVMRFGVERMGHELHISRKKNRKEG
jgi:hypothetical protein